MSPVLAASARRMMTVSPSRIPALIIEFAGHFERIMLAAAEERGGHRNLVAAVLERLDRRAGGDPAENGNGDRIAVMTHAARYGRRLTGIGWYAGLGPVIAEVAARRTRASFGPRQPYRLVACRGRANTLGRILRQA